jgi:hypothetical protein
MELERGKQFSQLLTIDQRSLQGHEGKIKVFFYLVVDAVFAGDVFAIPGGLERRNGALGYQIGLHGKKSRQTIIASQHHEQVKENLNQNSLPQLLAHKAPAGWQ